MGKKGNLGKMKGMLLMALLLFCAFLTGCSLLDIKDGGLGMTNPDYVEPEKDETDEENPEKAQYEKDPYEKYRSEKNQHEKNPDEEAQAEEDQAASWLVSGSDPKMTRQLKEFIERGGKAVWLLSEKEPEVLPVRIPNFLINGADGIAVGRGVLGDITLPYRIEKFLNEGVRIPAPTIDEKIETLLRHLEGEISLRGEDVGIKCIRKLYGYYISGVRNAAKYRAELVRIDSYPEMITALTKIRQEVLQQAQSEALQ